MAGFRFKSDAEESLVVAFDEGHRLHGLEITVRRRVPVGYFMAVARANVGESARLFATSVIGWNVEDDAGRPVPVSVEAFGEMVSVEDMGAIVEAWATALTAVPVPLAGT